MTITYIIGQLSTIFLIEDSKLDAEILFISLVEEYFYDKKKETI